VVDSRSADVGIQRDTTTTTPALLVLDAANHEPDVRNVERLERVFIIP
jgi:methylglyoxal synthase